MVELKNGMKIVTIMKNINILKFFKQLHASTYYLINFKISYIQITLVERKL